MRIPGWTATDAQVKINGQLLEAMADPGSYLALRKTWLDGDTITVSMPMELRKETLPGDDAVAAALYGPLVLAADLGTPPPDESSRVIHSGDTVPKNLPHRMQTRRNGSRSTLNLNCVSPRPAKARNRS
jgi:DUF1680 family protein